MRDGAQAPRGGGGAGGGFFSARSLSTYMRIVSSGASTAASTLRSAGASLVNSIASYEDDAGRDQVQWAGFDKVECGGGVLRQVLLLAYKSGFQVWDVEHADDVRQLESRHDGPVSFMQVLKNPIGPDKSEDGYADARPLLALVSDGTYTATGNSHDANVPGSDGTNGFHNIGTENLPTAIRIYSLRTHEYVDTLRYRSAVYSIRCSPRVVAVSQATQIHCLNASTLEKEYTVLTSPTVAQISGYGPLGLGPRWIAFSGLPVHVPNTGRVSPQLLNLSPFVPPPGSNGSVVAYYAKESSKQLAAGIVTLGDVGYKKLSKYCSDFIPNGNGAIKQRNASYKTNGVTNGHRIDNEYAGMVIVRDVVSKSVIVQFRAHTSPISALCFDPSGTLLVTASVHGQNINVFRIIPPPHGNESESGQIGTYVHLYKLQRGITNAIIKDISFSDDSEWIMISSSRGTSHLFAISPYSGSTSFHYSDNKSTENNYLADSLVKPTAHWSQNSAPSLSLCQKTLFMSGPPVTLSVVSRIRNGSNMFKGAVHGAAALATGVSNPISGAIASTFHNCQGADLSSNDGSLHRKYHLLVFSPSGSIIQYVLRLSAEQDSGFDFPSGPTYGSEREHDMRFVIEALQKWDVCYRRNRRDSAESLAYGDFENGENSKLFQKVMKKGTSVYPFDNTAVERPKLSADESRNFYISESELQTHVVQTPLWSRPGMHFQVMGSGAFLVDDIDTMSGEVEIEKMQTWNIETRSKNLIPVFESLHTSKFQPARLNTPDSNRFGVLQRQRSDISEGGLSCRSSCNSLDCMSEGPKSSDDGGFSKYLVDDSGSAVNKNPNVEYTEHVNNTGSLKSEAQLGFVNSKEDVEDREQLLGL